MTKKDRENLPQPYGLERDVPMVSRPKPATPTIRTSSSLSIYESVKQRWEVQARAGVLEAQNKMAEALLGLAEKEVRMLDIEDQKAWAKARNKHHNLYDAMAKVSIDAQLKGIENERDRAIAEAKNIIQKSDTERAKLRAEQAAAEVETAKSERKLDAIRNTNTAELIKQKTRRIGEIDAELVQVQQDMQNALMSDDGEKAEKRRQALQDRQTDLLQERGELIAELKELTGGTYNG